MITYLSNAGITGASYVIPDRLKEATLMSERKTTFGFDASKLISQLSHLNPTGKLLPFYRVIYN